MAISIFLYILFFIVVMVSLKMLVVDMLTAADTYHEHYRADDEAEAQEHADSRPWLQQAFEPNVVYPKMVKPTSKHDKPESSHHGDQPYKLKQLRPRNRTVTILVWQENQDYQSYDPGQPYQANPLRVTLSLGVVHTAPDKQR